ncbi:SRPBCC family protein [Agreia sp. Leaf210]|uniref:SRPBCC family protein n=1 Tax=Agreia sp. Leaf210 TaxID=1735682 RepID=UPI0006F61A1C|nr:SRPBCC domain-containing protein [Agreia sp. Leaf210]KQM58036.1 polyketide cyclase [Agreia sp. Leaf210]
MTVISVEKDTDALTLTFVAEFSADVERVWQVWEDPRQLERWWGPPTWPATFTHHELSVGSRSAYVMTGPDGTKAGGWWLITAVEAPARLEFDDGFADENGEPDDSIAPVTATVTFESIDGGTRMTTLSRFVSIDQLEKMVEMGMEEGMTLAMGQIDDVLRA